MSNNKNYYGGYYLWDNGCTTLTAWFVGAHTNLAYGHGNGEGVVRQLVSANSGLTSTGTLTSAQLPALYSVAPGYAVWGASGGSWGHTGIVVAINGNQATVVETWTGLANSNPRAKVSTYTIPTTGVTFVSLAGRTR
jgi:hypothetical protein